MTSRALCPSASAVRAVLAGAFIAAHAGEHDPPQGMVGLAVPAGVESMPIDLPGRGEQGGPTPQRCANAASLFSRSAGSSPAATNKIAALLIPTPYTANRLGAARRTSVSSSWSSRLASTSRASTRRPNVAIRGFRRGDNAVAPDGGSQRSRGACEPVTMHVLQLFTQLVRSGEAEMADLIQVLDAQPVRTTHDQQRPDRFDVTISLICLPIPDARPDNAARAASIAVEFVGLAVPALLLPIGSIDFDHHQPMTAEMTCQTGTVRTGSLHPNPHPPQRSSPANRVTRGTPPPSS